MAYKKNADYAKRTVHKDRHRKGYYRDYNLAHPERLERVGIHVDSVDGFVLNGEIQP